MSWSPEFPPISAPPPRWEQTAEVWNPEELDTQGGESFARSTPANGEAYPDLEALKESEQALGDAYARGYEEGQLAGEIAERMRLASPIRAAEELLKTLRERESRWTELAEENICALAIAMARQLVERAVEEDTTITRDFVSRALTEFPIDQPVTIRVNPSDLAAITASAVAEGGSLNGGRKDAQWIPDPRVVPGGCLIEGRDRIIDGRIDTALERLYRRLTYLGA
jgi:flagellar assembly protein FliH